MTRTIQSSRKKRRKKKIIDLTLDSDDDVVSEDLGDIQSDSDDEGVYICTGENDQWIPLNKNITVRKQKNK